jgi:hypothetical protein
MTTCAVCEEEIELEADEEPTLASCGLHEVHSYCDVPNLGCLICNPAPDLPVTQPPTAGNDPQAGTDGALESDGRVYYDAEEGTPEDWAAEGVTFDEGVEVPTPTGVSDATTEATAPVDDADDDGGRADHLAAAGRVARDVARAHAAREAAGTTITDLVGHGVTEESVLGVMDEIVPGYSTSYGVCAAEHLVGYDQMATWLPNAETTTYVNDTCDSYVAHSAVLEGATAALGGLRVVGIGSGFRNRLTDVGAHNVADMALGGPDYTGHNLHWLKGNLKGWASIRAEVGKIILVRWGDGMWEVGATGAHTKDDDYKLDSPAVEEFDPTLAYRLGGEPTLA